MFNEEERRKDIYELLENESTHHNIASWIISQEKSMIEQAVKNFAIKLFSHLEGYENNEKLRDTFNDVLEEYEVKI
jgi:hypothetical protein